MKNQNKISILVSVLISIFVISLISYGALTKTHTFTTGQVISASQMNTNFDQLFSAIGTQEFTEDNVLTDDETVTSSLDAVDQAIGDRAYTQNNYITDSADLSDTIEALDEKVKTNDGWIRTATTDQIINKRVQRAKFGWCDKTRVTIDAAAYFVNITTDRIAFWDSQLVFVFGPTGSNASSSALTASAWQYLYLDGSGIEALKVGNQLTAANFINSTVAPAKISTSPDGWYCNASAKTSGAFETYDRCIMAVTTDTSSKIAEFYHQGDKVTYANAKTNKIGTEDVFTQVLKTPKIATLIAPCFVNLVDATFRFSKTANDVMTYYFYTTDGITSSTGHLLGHSFALSYPNLNQVTLACGDTQKIYVRADKISGRTRIGMSIDGWRFPLGM